MHTGELIKQARVTMRITQAELAKRLGVTPQAISQYERGIKNPKPATLKKIAAALGVSWYELLSDDPHVQARGIVDDVSGRLQKAIAETGPMKKISTSNVISSGLLQIQFKSDDDQIAYLYSLLNDPGKFEASRCFFRHLDKESIPEVIAYLKQLANTPQYQKKPEE